MSRQRDQHGLSRAPRSEEGGMSARMTHAVRSLLARELRAAARSAETG